MINIKACLCEKIPEQEFDAHPRLNDGWEELCRMGGYVYIGYRPESAERGKASLATNPIPGGLNDRL